MTIKCKACNFLNEDGEMIISFNSLIKNTEAKSVAEIFTFVSSIDSIRNINQNDILCSLCYEDLLHAYNFKQKCIESERERVEEEVVEQNSLENNTNFHGKDIVESICDNNEEENIENNDNYSIINEKPRCKFCYTQCLNTKDLLIHQENHKADEKPYKCHYENCKSTFKERYALTLHWLCHSNIKRHKCEFCGKCFKRKPSVQAHVKSLHIGEKRYLCSHCGKAFNASSTLKEHLRIHTGERPFKCEWCDKSFKTKNLLTIHIRMHTNERPFECNECDRRFTTSGKLLLHKRRHTGEKPYECTFCPARFIESCVLKRHIKIHTTYFILFSLDNVFHFSE